MGNDGFYVGFISFFSESKVLSTKVKKNVNTIHLTNGGISWPETLA